MFSVVFPGQGSQSIGMGKELHKNFDLVKKIFKEADEKLNYPISKIILDGPESELKLTENTQPAILTVSYSIFKIITEEFNIDLKKGYVLDPQLKLKSKIGLTGQNYFMNILMKFREKTKRYIDMVLAIKLI